MATVTVPAPANLNGDQLEQELRTGGVDATVVLVGDMVEVTTSDPVDLQAVRDVVAAHVGKHTPLVDKAAEALKRLAAVEQARSTMNARLDALSVTGDAAKVRDAVRGTQ